MKKERARSASPKARATGKTAVLSKRKPAASPAKKVVKKTAAPAVRAKAKVKAAAAPARKALKLPKAALKVPKAIPALPRPEQFFTDLPFSYNETKLVMLVRDPTWAYAYWDFSSVTWHWAQDLLLRDRGARAKLRIHNLDAAHFYDLDVTLEAKNWYIDLGLPNIAFEAELGILDSHGRFHRIAKSNRIRTPRNGPAETIDPAWAPEDYDQVYKMSGGGRTGHGSEIFSQVKRR